MCGELPGDVAEQEFESYVAARWRPLLRSAWLLTGNWAAAEDLVQSALVLVWTSWLRVRVVRERDAYVRRTMTNQFLGQQRRLSSSELPSDAMPETSAPDLTAGLDQRMVLTR